MVMTYFGQNDIWTYADEWIFSFQLDTDFKLFCLKYISIKNDPNAFYM